MIELNNKMEQNIKDIRQQYEEMQFSFALLQIHISNISINFIQQKNGAIWNKLKTHLHGFTYEDIDKYGENVLLL